MPPKGKATRFGFIFINKTGYKLLLKFSPNHLTTFQIQHPMMERLKINSVQNLK